MVPSRPGGKRTGAWGSGNAEQPARCQHHGGYDDQEYPSVREAGDHPWYKGEAHRASQASTSADEEADRPLTAAAFQGCQHVEMRDAMGCQAHGVRGFLAGMVKKMPGGFSGGSMDRSALWHLHLQTLDA